MANTFKHLAFLTCVVGIVTAVPANAQRLENEVAVFAALDKVTANISRLEVPIGETVQFGSLKLTPQRCFSREPTEPPKTTTFVEIDEVLLDGELQRIFAGWMFAQSPGLNPVEHPVFDVWLTGCEKPVSRRAATGARDGGQDSGPPAVRRRSRR